MDAKDKKKLLVRLLMDIERNGGRVFHENGRLNLDIPDSNSSSKIKKEFIYYIDELVEYLGNFEQRLEKPSAIVSRLLLHPSQESLYQEKRLRPDKQTNCSFAFSYSGNLDTAALKKSYVAALSRFDAFNLKAKEDSKGKPYWIFSALSRFSVEIIDPKEALFEVCSNTSQIAEHYSKSVFHLDEGPLGIIYIVPLSQGSGLVIEVFDHIVVDGRSIDMLHTIVSREFSNNKIASQESSYLKFLHASASKVSKPIDIEFWRNMSITERGSAHLLGKTNFDASKTIELPAKFVQSLELCCGKSGSTLPSLFFLAHCHAIARYSGITNANTLTAFDCREDSERNVFGQATSLLPLIFKIEWRKSALDNLRRATRLLIEARDHSHLSAEQLDALDLDRSINRRDANVFVFQNSPSKPPNFEGLICEELRLSNSRDAGGVTTVSRVRSNGDISVEVSAGVDSPLGESIGDLTDTIRVFFKVFRKNPLTPMFSDYLLADKARSQILMHSLSDKFRLNSFGKRIEQTVFQGLKRKDYVVLEEGKRRYNSKELRMEVARRLRDLRRSKLKENAKVAVETESDFCRISSFLAILRFRAIYVPIEVRSPVEYKNYVLDSAGCSATFYDTRLSLINEKKAEPSNNLLSSWRQDTPAYIVFTSGSTGKPKGVVIGREALLNFATEDIKRFQIRSDSRLLLIAPVTFDPWIGHVSDALLSGSTLVKADKECIVDLSSFISQKEITHAFLPASLVDGLESTTADVLKVLGTAGDHCNLNDVRPFIGSGTEVYNIYGPTETTITALVAELDANMDSAPIGTPINGLGAEILIDGIAKAPPGVVGELAISGKGVGLGYINDPAGGKFTTDPIDPMKPVYMTGDTAFLGKDNQFYIRGRRDRQVKIRGFRVELDHLEKIALNTGCCSQARAIFHRSDVERGRSSLLILFVQDCRDLEMLKSRIVQQAPSFMRPNIIENVNRFPITLNDKIDDQKLLGDFLGSAIDFNNANKNSNFDTESSCCLGKCWEEIFGVSPNQGDDFFELGGDSLTVLKFVQSVRSLGASINPHDIYNFPIFSELKNHVEHHSENQFVSKLAISRNFPLSPSQSWFFSLNFNNPKYWNQHYVVPISDSVTQNRVVWGLRKMLQCTPTLTSIVDKFGNTYAEIELDKIEVEVLNAGTIDSVVRERLFKLASSLNPLSGKLFSSAILEDEDASLAVIMFAHHLVIDDWSWEVLARRLSKIIISEKSDLSLENDIGFYRFVQHIEERRLARLDLLDAPVWRNVLDSGETVTSVSGVEVKRHRAVVELEPALLLTAEKEGVSKVALFLSVLAHSLNQIEENGSTVIDLERNGRTSLPNLDLVDSVGWFAMHHPVLIRHVPFSVDSCRSMDNMLKIVPDNGISYLILRYTNDADEIGSLDVGRFAVNISESNHKLNLNRASLRLDSLRPEDTHRVNAMPYEATISLRLSDSSCAVEIDSDLNRMPLSIVEAMTTSISALKEIPRGRCPTIFGSFEDNGFAKPFPISAMQSLMLREALIGNGAYLPKQVLRFYLDYSLLDSFLLDLGTVLGNLDPFRRRFYRYGNDLNQNYVAANPVDIQLNSGGLEEAIHWMNGAENICPKRSISGGELIHLTCYTKGGSQSFLCFQIHHATADGQTNNHILDLVQACLGRQKNELDLEIRTTNNEHAQRKYISAEQALMQDVSLLSFDYTIRPSKRAVKEEVKIIDSRTVESLRNIADENSIDLKTFFSAAVVSLACKLRQPAYQVVNGRDFLIPGIQEAMGMYWYFLRLDFEDGEFDIWSLAKNIYNKLHFMPADFRQRFIEQFADIGYEGVSINYIPAKVLKGIVGNIPEIICSRDLLHFRYQLEVIEKNDNTLQVKWTTLIYLEDGAADALESSGMNLNAILSLICEPQTES